MSKLTCADCIEKLYDKDTHVPVLNIEGEVVILYGVICEVCGKPGNAAAIQTMEEYRALD